MCCEHCVCVVALDGQGEIESVLESDGRLSAVRGYSNELGYFDLKFEQGEGEGDLSYHFLEAYTPSLHLIKEAIQHYSSAVTMKNNHPKKVSGRKRYKSNKKERKKEFIFPIDKYSH